MSDTLFDLMDAPCPVCGRPMTNGECVTFCAEVARKGRHRRNDQPTSIAGARSVAYRAGSQKALLLAAFEAAYPNPISDEEAATAAGVPLTSEFSKRCGELRQDGRITQVEGVTKVGAAGVPRLTSVFNVAAVKGVAS